MKSIETANAVLEHLVEFHNSNSVDLAEATREAVPLINNVITQICYEFPDWLIKEDSHDGSQFNVFLLEKALISVKEFLLKGGFIT